MKNVMKNKTSSLSSSSVSVMNKAAAAVNDNDTAQPQPQPQPQAKKNLWRPEEDLILKTYIETHGEGNWATVSHRSGLNRSGKSCRLRWKNYLRPNIKRGHMSQDEQDLILRMHNLLGNRWSLIAGRLPGRTDNEVKNYWNTHLNKIITTAPSSPTNTRTPKRKTPHPPSTSAFNTINHVTTTPKKKNKIVEDPNSTTTAHPLVAAATATATTDQIQNQKHNISTTSTTHHLHHQEQEDSSSPNNYAMITTPTTTSTHNDEACFYYDHIQSPSRVLQHCHYYMQPTNHQSYNNAALAATSAAGFVFDDDPLVPTYVDLESFLLL